jgi:hypothetical protein
MVFGRQRAFAQVSEEYVLFFAVMRPICVHVDEVNRCIDEDRIDLMFRLNLYQGIPD